ncbi:guanylate kinase [Polymorphum gilvum]|uniref:Guanylate kinase n=1 Tax=Polymorphum gilvum (strain LMG 25793 / CGMCC 1.9160 / SL003B-26A1) TaxID=991905 RepID=F2J1M3_POLGS|nr:guanylate kinase [Polymorphum gilvum]ADZ70824.1 Guanylate kinase (GMP kinase) protein [Polymorphum gilvum SL003B-26A1]
MPDATKGAMMTSASAEAQRRGLMLVLSSPSGAGKSTIARLLLEKEDTIELSISVTTRPRRSSEIDGVHYHFVSPERFDQMRERGELLEWAEVHGNFYATPRDPVETALKAGRDVLFDIDIQGTFQLYERMREDVVSVFILPPSIAEMKSRLHRRAEDTEEVILRRLKTAVGEMRHWAEYDYVVVNDDLGRAYEGVRAILRAERLKQSRSPAIGGFIDGMLADLRQELGEV